MGVAVAHKQEEKYYRGDVGSRASAVVVLVLQSVNNRKTLEC